MNLKERLHAEARGIEAKIRGIRRTIHANPEPGFEEIETAALISRTLRDQGIGHETGAARTGVVATIGGSGPGPCVALRADMDALRKDESADASVRPHRSRKPGLMHACGHDGHVAVLLGTAEILCRMKGEFAGTVKLVFQPAEEGGGGGRIIMEEGWLDNPRAGAVFALHGFPSLPCGVVGLRHGTSMASAQSFAIDVVGSAGHAAYPHRCVDPVPAAAAIISSLQTVRSREINPNLGSVVSVTVLETGSRGPAGLDGPLRPSQTNIIPQTARLRGTSRALTLASQEDQTARIREIAELTAKAHRCRAFFWAEDGYPPTVNDRAMTDLAAAAAADLLGPDKIAWIEEPSMGGEDFAYYLLKIPGSIFRLGMSRGSSKEEIDREPPLHSDEYDWNDDALVNGMVMMAGTAIRATAELAG